MTFEATIAFWTALVTAVVAMTFETTRRLVLRRLSRKGVYVLVGSAIVSAIFGALQYWMYLTSLDLIALSERNIYRQLPVDWCSKTPTDICEKNSKAYVSGAFLRHGELLKHVDGSGQWVTFRPSQDQIVERERVVSVDTQLRGQAVAFARIAWAWWLSFVFAAAFGYLAARRKLAANSTAESDARRE